MVERSSPAKINLLLNILGKRDDGFHELETLLYPVPVADTLYLELHESGIQLRHNQPGLPDGPDNLIYRAASLFLETAGIRKGVRIELVKRIPIAAGLGGGSSNAANTLLGLNELFERPLGSGQLSALAASLGSDVPFFLQPNPALATGRGEQIFPLSEGLPALKGQGLLLLHPGFGVSTGWAYKNLARCPEGTSGRAGQAGKLAEELQGKELGDAAQHFYNSLEFPVFYKYPLLRLYKEFLLNEGACVALMSGSGSATFALIDRRSGEQILDRFQSRFGPPGWSALTEL